MAKSGVGLPSRATLSDRPAHRSDGECRSPSAWRHLAPEQDRTAAWTRPRPHRTMRESSGTMWRAHAPRWRPSLPSYAILPCVMRPIDGSIAKRGAYSSPPSAKGGGRRLRLGALRLQRGLPQRGAGEILQRHVHAFAAAVDLDLAVELHPGRWRQVLLAVGGRLLEHHLRPERVVELIGPEGPRVERTGDEFPERIEIGELRLRRIVEMRGGVVHVGGEPDHVLDAVVLDGAQEFGDVELAAEHRPVAVGRVLELRPAFGILAVLDHQAERHVGSDDLPGRVRGEQRLLEPPDLLAPEIRRLVTGGGLAVPAVGPAIAAHVDDEDVEGRGGGGISGEALPLVAGRPHGGVIQVGAR